jgi:MFS family permease
MITSRLPKVVWVLGLVSLCMDLSSEMIHALLPVFLISVLGSSTVTLGFIEGLAEGTASIAKVLSGVISDRIGSRKPLVLAGYGLAALSKPLFPLATSALLVLGARFIDRVGKGIRGAPRDALIADLAAPEIRGAAYGLRQALDTTGALIGPLAAIALMSVLANQVRIVFWIAALPALLAVLLLTFGVKEPPRHFDSQAPRHLPRWRDLYQLSGSFWAVSAIGAIVTLARFSEAFLVLRAHEAGLSVGWTPLALVVMNAVYVASAYPAGWLSDRVDRIWLLVVGLVALISADLVLAWSQSVAVVLVGVALWGLHMGLTQGLFAALVADAAPAELRGSAFGIFNFLCGVLALVASLIAGKLWEWRGPSVAFLAGAIFSAIALAAVLVWRRRPDSAEASA